MNSVAEDVFENSRQKLTQKDLDNETVRELNEKYHKLNIEARITELYKDFNLDQVMLTSSFATTSALLLSLFSRLAPHQKVFFIDTGFHFPETLQYKSDLTRQFNLDVVDIRAEAWKHDFCIKEHTWKTDPDFCCSINKVEPLETIKTNYLVWISGLMRWQSDHRATLDIFEQRNGILKFYPLVDFSREERDEYIRSHELPFHPLVTKGYQSVGCVHCTVPGEDRSGRWNNKPKTECGLHL